MAQGELPIHRQRRIVRVQRCQQVIVSGRDLPHKVDVGSVDLVNVHAAELRTEDVFPLVLVVIAQHIDQLALKLDVGQLVVPVAVAAVDGVPVQVEDPVFLLNDVLLGDAGGLGSDNVQSFRTGGNHVHELHTGTDGGLSGGGRPLQKLCGHALDRTDKVPVLPGQRKFMCCQGHHRPAGKEYRRVFRRA